MYRSKSSQTYIEKGPKETSRTTNSLKPGTFSRTLQINIHLPGSNLHALERRIRSKRSIPINPQIREKQSQRRRLPNILPSRVKHSNNKEHETQHNQHDRKDHPRPAHMDIRLLRPRSPVLDGIADLRSSMGRQ